MRRFLPFAALAAVLALGACTNAATTGATAATPSATSPAEDPKTVVAKIDGQAITLADLDQELQGKLRSMRQEYVEQVHKLRESGLEAMIVKRLVEAEAKKKGMKEEELVQAEVEGKVTPPTEEEMKAFFEQRAAQMPGAEYEALKPRIQQFLTGQKKQEAMFAYFDQLKAAAKVEITLQKPEAPRVEVAADGPTKGAKDAKVQIVEFSDFECPFCSRVNPTIERVMKEYEGKVKLTFRDYPLPFHQKAGKASEAGHCADEQGKFWEMHDRMFGNQQALEVADLKKAAGELGLDQAKFDACLDSGKMAEKVKKNAEDGAAAGVEGTPAFFVNGVLLSGAQPYEEFKRVIDQELTRAGVALPAAAAAPAAAPAAEEHGAHDGHDH